MVQCHRLLVICYQVMCKKPVSVHSVEVRFQARNSCGSNSAAVFKIKKIATKRVLNQNISARKRIRSILKSYQKQETIFVNLVACFFVRKDATIKETITREIVSKRR